MSKDRKNSFFDTFIKEGNKEEEEADRKGRRITFEERKEYEHCQQYKFYKYAFDNYIKGIVEDKLADAVIRLLDLYGLRGIDIDNHCLDNDTIESYAKTCERKSFTESIFSIVREITSGFHSLEHSAVLPEILLLNIFGLAKHLDINLIWHIEQKMKYNELRSIKHGKKY